MPASLSPPTPPAILSPPTSPAILSPPTSPASSPSSTTTVYVSATISLGGYTTSTFGTTQASQFKSALATILNVQSIAVTITSVMSPSGRHLLQSAVLVAFSVATTTTSASSLSASLTGVTGSSAISAFQTAGLNACTSVAISTPSTGTSTPVDATSQLPVITSSSACNMAPCNGCTSCAAAQTCTNTYICSNNQYVTFQCSASNGVVSWSASCASSTSTRSAPLSSCTIFSTVLGLICAAMGALI